MITSEKNTAPPSVVYVISDSLLSAVWSAPVFSVEVTLQPDGTGTVHPVSSSPGLIVPLSLSAIVPAAEPPERDDFGFDFADRCGNDDAFAHAGFRRTPSLRNASRSPTTARNELPTPTRTPHRAP